ncbi:unnamed protein product [Orchesella dallaii]|uniref:RING-type domain-containing protein n=1 Tax=Orchesella dallaii TaxID=48710 RepID=A0ABP1QKY8_9HEXA
MCIYSHQLDVNFFKDLLTTGIATIGSIFSSIFGTTLKSSTGGANQDEEDAAAVSSTTIPTHYRSFVNNGLKFHSAHGTAIRLSHNSTIAKRDEEYFERSVVFSHRPIGVNEMVAVEIVETTEAFHGPMRVGFTAVDPAMFLCPDAVIPLGRDLKNMTGFWVKSIHMFPMCVGTVAYFKLHYNGIVLYGVNGKQEGIYLRDVDTSRPLWVVLEAYGTVQSFKFVDRTMHLSMEDISLDEPISPMRISNAITRRSTRSSSRRQASENLPQIELPLLTRRNVRLSQLQKSTRVLTPTSPNSSSGHSNEQFFSPGPFDEPNGRGMCIICVERERNTAFTKCGHICMCYNCATTYKNPPKTQGSTVVGRRSRSLCPICRQPISSILKIFY